MRIIAKTTGREVFNMRERLLSPQEIRIILGAEEPRRWKWNWRRAAYNLLYVVPATTFVIAVLTYMVLMLFGFVEVR